jgi:homoserine dehydrogenase
MTLMNNAHKPAINIGMLGLGTVGTGVAKVLTANAHNIAQKVGAPIVLKKVLVRDLRKPRQVDLGDALTTDLSAIVDDPSIDIVVELMGGEEPAKSYILRALAAGKHVVTANKDVIARHGRDLFGAAEANAVDLLSKPASVAAYRSSGRSNSAWPATGSTR